MAGPGRGERRVGRACAMAAAAQLVLLAGCADDYTCVDYAACAYDAGLDAQPDAVVEAMATDAGARQGD